MTCTNCGSYIPAGKRFCADCGEPVVDPEETRLARTQSSTLARSNNQPDHLAPNLEPGEVERTIFVARPTALFVGIGYAAAAVGAILFTVLLSMIPRLNIPWYVVIPLALALFLIPAYYHLRRNMIQYTLTDSSIQIDQGLLSRTTRNIPLRTIQDVVVQASIPQRIMGYGNIIIDNASEQGGEVMLHNIHDPRGHADLLLRELRRWR
ncbi:MAG TPA: PH domain-containing protein [Pyrinomonadaceae bacterium]|nr:PH domain-containing protein [Pyrinomonadaceae bacterium]